MKIDKKKLLKMTGRFIWFIFFTGIIITSCVLVEYYGPSKTFYDNNSFNFSYDPEPISSTNNLIFDQHSHTLYSDGILTLEQNIKWHIANGFNACVITDHNTMNHKEELEQLAAQYSSEIIVIMGMEWTTGRLHMNFLGLQEWDFEEFPINRNPTDQEIQDAIDEAHRQNAVVTIDHIPWSIEVAKMENHPTRQQLLDWEVDYIEIVNEGTYDEESVEWCNNTGGFGMITGTDMHRPDQVWGWTGMNVTEFSEDAIMTELRARRTAIYYNATGSPNAATSYPNTAYELIKPLALVGELFENYYDNGLDWLGIGIFTAYMIGVFFIAELLRVVSRKFWEKININQKS